MNKASAIMLSLICATCISAQVDWSTKPHLERTGPNLVQNPSFNGSARWDLGHAVVYDPGASRTPDSGSMKLTSPTPAISKGARAMGFWIDCVNGCTYDGVTAPPIVEQPWWDDFPNIRREIDQLLPLIRRPHWTTWRLRASSSMVQYGTRDYQERGHVIVANESNDTQSAVFTIEGLNYIAATVRDYFTGELIAPVVGSSFSITLPPYGTAVYRIDGTTHTAVDETAGDTPTDIEWPFYLRAKFNFIF